MLSEISVLSDANDKSLEYTQDFLAEINTLESRFNDRYNNVVAVYEERIKHLSEAVQHLFTDEIVTEMRNDPTSASFVKAYLERSVDHHFNTERETFTSNILRKLSVAETKVYKLKHVNVSLSRIFSHLLEKDKAFESFADGKFIPVMKKVAELSRRYNEYCVESDKEILDLRTTLQQSRQESDHLKEELCQVTHQLSEKTMECKILNDRIRESQYCMEDIERIKTQMQRNPSLEQYRHQQEERLVLQANFEQQLRDLAEDQDRLLTDYGELVHLLNNSVDEIAHIRAHQSEVDRKSSIAKQEISQALNRVSQLCTGRQSNFSGHRDADFITQLYDKLKVYHQAMKCILFKSMKATEFIMQDILYFKLLNECENPARL